MWKRDEVTVLPFRSCLFR